MKKILFCLLAVAAMVMTGCKKETSLSLSNQTQYLSAIVVYHGEANQTFELQAKQSLIVPDINPELLDSVAVQCFDDNGNHTSVFRTGFPESKARIRAYEVVITKVVDGIPYVSVGLNAL